MRLLAQERRYDIGNFESYFRAFVEFALADPAHGAELRSHLRQMTQDGPLTES
jgi:UTP--glucose-1-phosphate uridylyltransferase